MKHEDVRDQLIAESLRRIRAWDPPVHLGQRLAASLMQAQPLPRFRVRIPPMSVGAAAGLAAALVGGFGHEALAVAPAWLIGTVMLGVTSWIFANTWRVGNESSHG